MSWAIKDRIALALNPLLLRSAHARLILGVIADYADESGRCWPSVATLSARVDHRVDEREIRRARKQLIECGLLIETGETVRRVPVVRVLHENLITVAKGRIGDDGGQDEPGSKVPAITTHRVTSPRVESTRNHDTQGNITPGGSYPVSNLPRVDLTPGSPGGSYPPEATIEATTKRYIEHTLPSAPIEADAAPASPVRVDDEPEWMRGLQPPPVEAEPEPSPPPPGGTWLKPSEMQGDSLVAAMRASREAKAKAKAAAPAAQGEQAPDPRSAAERRVAEAVESLIPLFAAYYLDTVGMKHPARIEDKWRQHLPARLVDLGTTEQAVAARADGIRRVLAWWRLPHRDAAPYGVPSCWMDTSKRTLPFLLKNTTDPAGHCDKVIGWASEPPRTERKQQSQRPRSYWSKGGQHYGRREDAHDEVVF